MAFEDLLSREPNRPDYFVVCTPNDLHAAHAALGLRIGANVILEKPAALSCRELEALTGLQAQSGHVIHPVLQVRYHGGLLRFRKLMELAAMGPARLKTPDVIVTGGT